jgi:hypothetical protein
LVCSFWSAKVRIPATVTRTLGRRGPSSSLFSLAKRGLSSPTIT